MAQVEGEDEEVVNIRGYLELHHVSDALTWNKSAICVTIRLPDGFENKNFVIKPIKNIIQNLCTVCDITALQKYTHTVVRD